MPSRIHKMALFCLLFMSGFFTLQAQAQFAFFDNQIESPFIVQHANAKIISLLNHEILLAESDSPQFQAGELLAVFSASSPNGVVGFVQVMEIEKGLSGTSIYRCRLSRMTGRDLILVGDELQRLNLRSYQQGYDGSTELLIRDSKQSLQVSSRYRLLPTMGLTLGETAETLAEHEFYFNFYGLLYFGASERLTVGTLLPEGAKGNLNVSGKYKLYDSALNVLSVGTTIARIEKEKRSTINLNLMWDSIGNESLISHFLLTMSLENSTPDGSSIAIKGVGSSSIQNTYEILLKNWDRVLIGPSYNFEKKSVGGIIAYMKIWDRFHLQFGVGASDIASTKWDPSSGYYALFDMFWRI